MPFIIVRDDITTMQVDASVNAANESLLGGGGVDGQIHRAAGPKLLEECRTLGGCETGGAKITKGYNLPAKYIIHAVGPVWQGGSQREKELLASCYRQALQLAADKGLESVAFPLISSGIYGYPKDQALQVAADTIRAFLEQNDMLVYLAVFDRKALEASQGLFQDIQSFIDEKYVEERADWLETTSRRRVEFSGQWEDAVRRNLPPRAWELQLESPLEQTPWETDDEAASSRDYTRRQHPRPYAKTKRGLSLPRLKGKKKSPPLEETQEMEVLRAPAPAMAPQSLADRLKQMDETFSQTLLRRIDLAGLSDPQCYKKANVDRKLFSKIRGDIHYRPSKQTAIAFALALEMSLEDTQDLLRKAGYALSPSSKADIIVEYFILHNNYDIFEINQALFAFDQVLLGA